VTITRLTSIHEARDLGSSATARIDLPVVVLATNSESTPTAVAQTRNTTTCSRSNGTPRIVQVPVRISGWGYPFVFVPKTPRADSRRKSEAPMAVMRGTSRGAPRSGR
jgi:hypothetical protein